MTYLKTDFKRLGERDSMYVDPMKDEGFGDLERLRERALDRETWRDLESWKIFCYGVSQLISDSTHSLQLSPNNTKVDYGQ